MHAVRRFVSLLILGTLVLVLLVFAVGGPNGLTLATVGETEYEGVKQSAHVIRIGPGTIRFVADIKGRAQESVEHGKTGPNEGEDKNENVIVQNRLDELLPGSTPDAAAIQNTSSPRMPSDSLFDKTKGGPHHNSVRDTAQAIMENVQSGGDIAISSARNSSGRARSDDMTCTPRKNLLFLKTHKTGSSTIQNIVYRYGDSNGLTFALPKAGVYMGASSLFQRTFPIKSQTGKYNMLANHARYYRPEMAKIMHDNAAYITVIRHPSTQFDSMYTFYGFKGRFQVDLAEFADNPLRYYPRQGSTPLHSALNPTLYDLGMATSEFSSEEAVYNKIATLEREFDLVLVSEYLMESLVLLKDLMCWDFSDVTYFSANARTKSKVNEMSERTFNQLYKWNHGDALLYEHFNRTLWRKVETYGRERMARDVKTLEKMNKSLAEKCLGGTKAEKSVSTLVSRYVLKDNMHSNVQCVRMIRPAIQYLEKLKKKQAGNHRRL